MKALEGRIEALERAKDKPLPLYAIILPGGIERHLDALELHLYIARMKAGIEQPILSARRVQGTMPAAGTAWEDLQEQIESLPG